MVSMVSVASLLAPDWSSLQSDQIRSRFYGTLFFKLKFCSLFRFASCTVTPMPELPGNFVQRHVPGERMSVKSLFCVCNDRVHAHVRYDRCSVCHVTHTISSWHYRDYIVGILRTWAQCPFHEHCPFSFKLNCLLRQGRK